MRYWQFAAIIRTDDTCRRCPPIALDDEELEPLAPDEAVLPVEPLGVEPAPPLLEPVLGALAAPPEELPPADADASVPVTSTR